MKNKKWLLGFFCVMFVVSFHLSVSAVKSDRLLFLLNVSNGGTKTYKSCCKDDSQPMQKYAVQVENRGERSFRFSVSSKYQSPEGKESVKVLQGRMAPEKFDWFFIRIPSHHDVYVVNKGLSNEEHTVTNVTLYKVCPLGIRQ